MLKDKLEDINERMVSRKLRLRSPETLLILLYFLHTDSPKVRVIDIRKFFAKYPMEGLSKNLNSGRVIEYIKPLLPDVINSTLNKENSNSFYYNLDIIGFVKEYVPIQESSISSVYDFIKYLKKTSYSRFIEVQKSNRVNRFDKISFYTYLLKRYEEFAEKEGEDEELYLGLLIKLYQSTKYEYGYINLNLNDIASIKEKHLKFSKKSKEDIKLNKEHIKAINKLIYKL